MSSELAPPLPPPNMPLRSHLRDLRRVALRIGGVLLASMCLAFFAVPWAFHVLLHPFTALMASAHSGTVIGLQTLDPSEAFRLSFTIALLMGGIVSAPYAVYQIWKFVRPGLQTTERSLLRIALLAGTGLFSLGVVFAFYVVLPLLLDFFWSYSISLGLAPNWTIGAYYDFMLGQLLAFGVAFELPLLLVLLAEWRIITAVQLHAARRYIYFGIIFIAAALTPPDIVSCLLMGIPLVALYEGAYMMIRLRERVRPNPHGVHNDDTPPE